MAAASLPQTARELVRSARSGHVGLFWLGAIDAAAAVVFLVLAAADPRTVLGSEVWIKPTKFAISFTLYGFALALLLGQLAPVSRAARRAGSAIVVAAVIEMVIIVGQAARGVRSHFNLDTPFDTMLFNVMGATIAVLYVATIVVAVSVLRRPGAGVVIRAVQYGLVITVVGLSVGIVMVLNEAHTVGGPDGGPGLPFVGWSTQAGDLRIGHFLGLHALQALPVAAVALGVVGRDRWSELVQRRLVGVLAAGYTAVVLLVTAQALRGQPLLDPDVLTVSAAVLLVGAAALALVLVLRDRETTPSPAPVGGALR